MKVLEGKVLNIQNDKKIFELEGYGAIFLNQLSKRSRLEDINYPNKIGEKAKVILDELGEVMSTEFFPEEIVSTSVIIPKNSKVSNKTKCLELAVNILGNGIKLEEAILLAKEIEKWLENA